LNGSQRRLGHLWRRVRAGARLSRRSRRAWYRKGGEGVESHRARYTEYSKFEAGKRENGIAETRVSESHDTVNRNRNRTCMGL
jgi:hypothetical protein